MTIKIVLPEGEGPKPCNGTKVYTESGHEIEGVNRIKIDIRSDCILEAEMTVSVSSIENLNGIEGIVVVDRPPSDSPCKIRETIRETMMKCIRSGKVYGQNKRGAK